MCVSVLEDNHLVPIHRALLTKQMRHGKLEVQVPGLNKAYIVNVTRRPTMKTYKRNIGKKFSVLVENDKFTIYSSNSRDNSFFEYIIFPME